MLGKVGTAAFIIVFILVVVPICYWIVRGVTGGFKKGH
jgi:hypothetical protein